MGRQPRDKTGAGVTRAGVMLLGAFFCVATLILIAAGSALVWPDTFLEAVWKVYEARRATLMPYRQIAGPGFLALSLAMAAASAGCLGRHEWGRRLAIAIFAVNGASDVAQLILGHYLEGGIGVVAAGLLIFWLTRPLTRSVFS